MVTTRGGIIALVVLVGESVSGMATPLVVTEPAHAQILQDMQRCESKHGVTHNQLFSAGPMLIMLSEDGMDLGSFWKIIEDARSGANDDEVFLRKIDSSLQMLKPEQLVEFESHRVKLDAESYTWRLWGAAYLMNGGCGDDCFDYFRAWLMSRGRQTFETALKDPDTLARFGRPGSRARELEAFPVSYTHLTLPTILRV